MPILKTPILLTKRTLGERIEKDISYRDRTLRHLFNQASKYAKETLSLSFGQVHEASLLDNWGYSSWVNDKPFRDWVPGMELYVFYDEQIPYGVFSPCFVFRRVHLDKMCSNSDIHHYPFKTMIELLWKLDFTVFVSYCVERGSEPRCFIKLNQHLKVEEYGFYALIEIKIPR